MTSKALAYAEANLGVHQVHEEANAAREELDKLLGDLDKAHDTKRGLTAAIEGRSFDLLYEERAKHADMSATGLDQHMKSVRHRDPDLTTKRAQLDQVMSEIQGLEYDAEILRLRIKIAVARMEELGGYLHYLAAVKQAATPTTPTTPAKDQP